MVIKVVEIKFLSLLLMMKKSIWEEKIIIKYVGINGWEFKIDRVITYIQWWKNWAMLR